MDTRSAVHHVQEQNFIVRELVDERGQLHALFQDHRRVGLSYELPFRDGTVVFNPKRGSFPKRERERERETNGYLTLGVGKYFHDGGGGLGEKRSSSDIHPSGPGLPPLADRNMSWSKSFPIQFPNQTQLDEMYGKIPFSVSER